MTTREPTVFVVDDDLAMRESLCWLISSINVPVKAFSSAREFLDELQPDWTGCVIIDVRMPGMSGLELQDVLATHFDGLASIIITGHADVQMAVRAMKSGALDFLEKPFDDQELLELVQQAIDRIVRYIQNLEFRREIQERFDSLSQRERQVLDGLMAGNPTKVIARDLGLSPKTVEVHRGNITKKMKAKCLVQIAVIVTRFGLIKEYSLPEWAPSQFRSSP